MKPGKRIATWHNDGTPHGRWEWEPPEGPPQPPLWRETGFPLLVGVVFTAFVLAVLSLLLGVELP